MNDGLSLFVIKLANESGVIKILSLLDQLGHSQNTDNLYHKLGYKNDLQLEKLYLRKYL